MAIVRWLIACAVGVSFLAVGARLILAGDVGTIHGITIWLAAAGLASLDAWQRRKVTP